MQTKKLSDAKFCRECVFEKFSIFSCNVHIYENSNELNHNRLNIIYGLPCRPTLFNFTFHVVKLNYFIFIPGIGYGFIYTPSMMVISKYFEKKRALATGIAVSGSSVGQLITPILIRALIDYYGIRGALIIYAGINLNVLVAAALMRPFSFYKRIKAPPNSTAQAKETEIINQGMHSKSLDGGFGSTGNLFYGRKYEMSNSTGSLRILDVNDIKENATKEKRVLKEDEVSFIMDEEQAFDISYRNRRETCWAKYGSDFSLFKRWIFVFYTIGLCLTYIAYMNPIIFIPAYAKDQGVGRFMSSVLVSIIGVGDFVGRIASGWFGNLGIIKRNRLLAITQSLSSLILIIATCFPGFTAALVISVSHGVFAGTLFSLMTVVLVDFLGLENLSSGLGLSFMLLGMTQAPMPAILGKTF